MCVWCQLFVCLVFRVSDLVGGTCLLIGVILFVLNMCMTLINLVGGLSLPMWCAGSGLKGVASFNRVRYQLGTWIAVGLQILIVADILETLSADNVEKYEWSVIGKFSAIAAFRYDQDNYAGLVVSGHIAGLCHATHLVCIRID